MVYNRLNSHFENNNLLPKSQCGFRKITAVWTFFYIWNYIKLALRTKKVLLIVFFDTNNAFDSSSHVNILYYLRNKGIKGKLVKWLYDFLSNRSFKVGIGSTISDQFDKKSGVPHSAILSSLLFSIHHKCQMFIL